MLVFDLDPGEGIEWTFVRETALRLRELLNSEGHDNSWPKLTGGSESFPAAFNVLRPKPLKLHIDKDLLAGGGLRLGKEACKAFWKAVMPDGPLSP